MATRGQRPKASALRLVDGTHRTTRHGAEEKTRAIADDAVEAFGPLKRPAGLKGEALRAWKKYVQPAGWLDGSKEPAAIAFCALWAEFHFAPNSFPASKHGQLRAYMQELGLTDERNRIAAKDEAKDEFFDD